VGVKGRLAAGRFRARIRPAGEPQGHNTVNGSDDRPVKEKGGFGALKNAIKIWKNPIKIMEVILRCS
jgi:hypothetical protein